MPGGSVSRLVVRAESHLRHTNEYPRAIEYGCSPPMGIVVYFRVCFCFFFLFLVDCFTRMIFPPTYESTNDSFMVIEIELVNFEK